MTATVAITTVSLVSIALFLAWGYASWKALPALTEIDGPMPGPVWLSTLRGQLFITGIGGLAAATVIQSTGRAILATLGTEPRMGVLEWAVLAILAALGFVVGRLFTGLAMGLLVKIGHSPDGQGDS